MIDGSFRTQDPRPPVTLALFGDVMTGRGIDQVLSHPCGPRLYESFVRDARQYVELAEAVHGPIPRSAPDDYIWGDAIAELDTRTPDARIINLETSITTSSKAWPKGINYRMHPKNIHCLTVAAIDCCVLANNHVLDWSYTGLHETMNTLSDAGIRTVGAGSDAATAMAPAVLPLASGGRLLVFAAATGDSGVSPDWAATPERAGINRLPDISDKTLQRIAMHIDAHRGSGDIVVFSVHWGGNWGYDVPSEQRRFARGLIDRAGVDIVHGHSSHHVKGSEIYDNRPIFYSCGDFLNDYEGIGGHEHYRSDLGLIYFLRVESASGRLIDAELVPTRIRRFRIERAGGTDHNSLVQTLEHQCGRLGAAVERKPNGALGLTW